MRIVGIDKRTLVELEHDLAAGGRFVLYESCISLIVITLRRPSPVRFLRPGELGIVRGLPYTVISLLLGWWGLPWGVIYTPLALLTNLSGGRDVTAAVWPWLQQQPPTS
jgi:hypothetical protein